MELIILLVVSIIFGVIIPGAFIIYSIYSIIAQRNGAPYVPTSNSYLNEILTVVKPKDGQVFLELGSGDGRMVRKVVREFGVFGVGVEFHPALVWYSRILAKFQKLKQIKFIRQNLFDYDFSKADIIFSFLMPKANLRLAPKILKECQKGTIIISQGFEIKEFKKKMFKRIDRQLFSTYFYKL